jgi:hypothetical protein
LVGACFLEQREPDGAIPWLRMALKAKRRASYCFPPFDLGRVFEAKGQLDKALVHYHRALAAKPAMPWPPRPWSACKPSSPCAGPRRSASRGRSWPAREMASTARPAGGALRVVAKEIGQPWGWGRTAVDQARAKGCRKAVTDFAKAHFSFISTMESRNGWRPQKSC